MQEQGAAHLDEVVRIGTEKNGKLRGILRREVNENWGYMSTEY